MKDKFQNNLWITFTAAKEVFRDFRYMLLAGCVALIVFALSTWLPNIGLVLDLIKSPSVPFQQKIIIPIQLLGAIQTNFSVFSAAYTIAIVVLFGVNVAMVAYYIKRRKRFLQQSGMVTSFGGLASGMLGVGCAACGTFVLAPLLSLIGAGGLIAALPFGGGEFGILSIGILGFSIHITAKKIQDPLVCRINKPRQ